MAKKSFARNIKKEYSYVPVSERYEETEEGEVKYDDEGNKVLADKPATFKFKPLNARQLKSMQDNIVQYRDGGDTLLMKGNTNNYSIVQEQVIDIENVDVEVEFERGVLSDKMMDIIQQVDDSWINEIAGVIVSVSRYPDDADTHLGNF